MRLLLALLLSAPAGAAAPRPELAELAAHWRPLLPRTAQNAREYCSLLDRLDGGADKAEVDRFFDEHLHGASPYPLPAYDFDCQGSPRKPLWKPTFSEKLLCALADGDKRRRCPGDASECAPLDCSSGASDLKDALKPAGQAGSANAVVARAFDDVGASNAAAADRNPQLERLLREKASVPQAATAAPTAAAARPGFFDRLSAAAKTVTDALSPAPPPTAAEKDRQRIYAAYAGLEPFVARYAPEKAAAFKTALAGCDEAALAALEKRVLAAARADAHPPLSAGLSSPRAGRLLASADPKWSAQDWDRYLSLTLPLEARVALKTDFPVVLIDRAGGRALVFRGEDYGVDAAAKEARAELDARVQAADGAAKARDDAQARAEDVKAKLAAAERERAAKDAAAEAAAREAERARAEAEAAAAALESANKEAQAADEEARRQNEASADQIRKALLESADGIDLEILFAFGSARLSAAARPQLDQLGQALSAKELEGRDVAVNGHTDAKGSAAYNVSLSRRRAEAVKDYLVEHFHLSPERLRAAGFGSERLKLPDQPYSEKNRRVQIALVRDEQEDAAKRSELEARAAQKQAELESRAAEKAQAAAEAARRAAAAADAQKGAAERALAARQDALASASALAAARKEDAALAAALPGLEKKLSDAQAAVAPARAAADRAEEAARGVLYVRDFRANHYSWFGAPEQLSARLAETLTQGFKGWGAEGAQATSVFARHNLQSGRTLAQDLAEEMVRTEDAKSNVSVFKEQVGDLFTLLQGRWLDVAGRVAGGRPFMVHDLVPDTVDKREKPVPVELVSAAELARLSPKPEAATAPVVADQAADAPAADAPANAAAPAEQAADEASTKELAAQAKVREQAEQALTRAKRLAEQASAAAEAARRARQQALAAAAAAKAKGATAAQIRDALTRRAAAASIDLDIPFDFGSAQLTARALPQLEELGRALTSPALSGRSIFLYGHTDKRGTAEYNLDLSRRRAEAVRAYLVAHFGLAAAKLDAEGFGFSRLKRADAPFSDENRRVQVGLLQ